MTEKTANILKALLGLIIAIVCFSLKTSGSAEGSFTYIGMVLGVFIFIGFMKKAFDL